MNSHRILIISLLVFAALVLFISTSEASPEAALDQLHAQAGLNPLVVTDLNLEVSASQPEKVTSGLQDEQRQPGVQPARQQPAEPQAPDVVADLSVSIQDAPDPVFLSRPLVYTVTVTNNTTAVTITNVILTDTLPAAATFVSAVPSQGTGCGSSNPLICNLGSIRGGSTARVVITVTPTATGSLTNSARVRSTDPDPDPNTANNTASATTTVNLMADLSLALRVSNPTPNVGSAIAFTVTVSNAGPSQATGVNVRDLLPNGYTYVSFTSSQGSYNSSNGNWNNLTINAGASAWLRINVTVNATGSYFNYAQVMASGQGDYDSTAGNNSTNEDDDDTLATTPNAVANLSVTLADTPDPINAGANLTYNMTVSNAGPSIAVGVVVTNTLPANVTYQSFTGANWSCTPSGALVRCTRAANLASGANDSLAIVARVNSSLTSGTLNDSVLVRSTTSDPVMGNNTAATTTTVTTSADLSVSKVDTVDPVEPGTGMAYTISINNLGPSDAAGVRITDTLPTGVTYVTHVPLAEWSCSLAGSELRCSRAAAILSGGNAQLNVAVMVGTGVTGALNNTVRVGATTPDPASANNTDTETTTVIPRADLSLTKEESSDPVIAGTNLTYTLTVSNQGPSNAASLVLTDTLPSNVTYQSFSGTSWSCSLLSGNRLRCTRASLIANGSSEVIIRVNVNPGVSGTINNTAVVRSAAQDSTLTDNTATASTTVNRVADLSLSKTDSPDPVAEGQTLTYRVAVRNNGPSNAAAVSLSDALPTARVTFGSAVSTQGTCSWSSPNVSCSLGAVTTGTTVTVTITTTARPVGDNQPKNASNAASVTSTTTDPNTANNSQTITTQVLPAADLQVNLTSQVTTIQTGNPLTYTIEITNNGPSIATNVVVTDTLPAGLTFKASSRTPTATSPDVVWNLGNMNDNQSISFTVVLDVNSPTQTIVNSVAARSGTWDVVTANSVDQVNVEVIDSVVPTALWKLPVAAEGVYIVTGPTVLLEVEAADNVGVAYVRFYRWDSVLNKLVEIGNDSTASACQSNPAKLCYQWNLITSVLNPKWNEIRAQAYDASGNYSPDGYRILLKYFSEKLFLPLTRK